MTFAHPQQWSLWLRKQVRKVLRKNDRPDSVTVDDLKSSIGRGPNLSPDEIAHTYHNSEEFLASFEEARDNASSS